MPFFSIVVPLYNKDRYITATIDCVLRQSFTDYELLVVNDGSTDRSLELASRYNDQRIKIFNQNNQGAAAARNAGIKESTANYICFLDADDAWSENHLETLFHTIQKFSGAGMYCARYVERTSTGVLIKVNFDGIDDNYEGYVPDFFAASFKKRIALTSAVCISKKVFNEIGGFDETISSGQDLDYWIRIALKYPVVISKRVTVFYTLSTKQSLSKTDINNKTLPDFKKFVLEEQKNATLKRFLDLHRVEYALHFHITGHPQQRDAFLATIKTEHLPKKVAILMKLPPALLRCLLSAKRLLKNNGIDFSVYH